MLWSILILPSLLGLNSIRNELDWAPKALEFAGHEFASNESHANRRVHIPCACAPVSAMQLWQILYCFEAPDVSFLTQLKPHHLDLCSSSYGRLSVKRSAWQLSGSFIFSWVLQLFMLLSSFPWSNLCLLNLKSLNKHIKASNRIKEN